MSEQNTFEHHIERGLASKLISFKDDDRKKITYHARTEKSYSFKDPEEKVRAAYFVELILDYQYPIDQIELEVVVPRRTPSDLADIVIYSDEECKEPFLVIECKKEGITSAEYKQAIEQAFGNANSLRSKYAAVIAGNTRTAFDVSGFKPEERERNIISNIPTKFGKVSKFRFIKGDDHNDLKEVSREELISTLEKCHDTVWQGGKLAPTTAFDEVSKLLFCKLKDEKDIVEDGRVYQFQIGTHESAVDVFNRVDGIYQKAKLQDAEVFKGSINLDPKVVYQVVEHIQGINFGDTDLDTKGVAFERFMQDFFKGKMGQFFTPRKIIEFGVKLMEVHKDHYVLDPASGSGGFLLNTLDTLRKYAETNIKNPVQAYSHWHDFAKDNLFGIEINDQIARVCKMNMIIHDDGHTNVISSSALEPFSDIQTIHKGFKKDHFDIVITNPPFGATIKSSETDILETFDLGKGRKNQKTEILFIERCIDFVKPGIGKLCLVLPDGILTNSSLQYVRDFMMERCQIDAVISLPQFAFSHYGAGVKSSLVFLRRKGNSETLDDYPIFMAIADRIGYDATGREDKENDLDKILEEYHVFKSSPAMYEGC